MLIQNLIVHIVSGKGVYDIPIAPVAQLDRALPSEGRGQRFESSRVRQLILVIW